ncbi:Uncharacterized protein TCM_042433 [Theobroma cacao]|uniref:Uncharacterized protein n=1 Tax=Theobroma cacao TaxID=3641 RepID=A0A061FK44_THECC|nr:Uncharacterized protein TCM_042433 [Theobroma cacao]
MLIQESIGSKKTGFFFLNKTTCLKPVAAHVNFRISILEVCMSKVAVAAAAAVAALSPSSNLQSFQPLNINNNILRKALLAWKYFLSFFLSLSSCRQEPRVGGATTWFSEQIPAVSTVKKSA